MDQYFMVDWRNDVLLLWKEGNVCVADLSWPGKEVPVLSDLRTGTGVEAAFGVRWASKCAVHDAPFTVNDDCVPPVIRSCYTLDV